MEGVHPEDHLLEGSGGHHPHEHAVDLAEVDSVCLHARPARAHVADDPGERDRVQPDVERLGRSTKVLDVPAEARDECDQMWRRGGAPGTHEKNERTMTSVATWPKT